VPPDATKETHMDIREQFKVVSLGVLYGLSEVGLAQRLNIAPCDARRLLRLHREVFQRFWEWSDAVEVQGMLAGALQTVFGWWLHVGPNINPRTLRNFPTQGNAAEMMRLACCLAVERGIQVDAVIHDALLVEGGIETIESLVEETQAAMQEASELVLPGFPLRSEAKIVRYPDRYTDPRGMQMWETVQALLKETTIDVPF
jgi:DNA polymerase I